MARVHELEADNIVLISIIEKNIETMQRAAMTISLLQNYEPAITPAATESILQLNTSIVSCREFLSKLFQEGKYPIEQ